MVRVGTRAARSPSCRSRSANAASSRGDRSGDVRITSGTRSPSFSSAVVDAEASSSSAPWIRARTTAVSRDACPRSGSMATIKGIYGSILPQRLITMTAFTSAP
jgi:hypothetical protein